MTRNQLVIIEELDATSIEISTAVISTIHRLLNINQDGNSKPGSNIKRPIVIVCSDPWSFSLKAIRGFSHMINITTSYQRLAERLKCILSQENIINYDISLLERLVELSNGDIRECLYSLQFSSNEIDPVSKAIASICNISCTPSSNVFFKVCFVYQYSPIDNGRYISSSSSIDKSDEKFIFFIR